MEIVHFDDVESLKPSVATGRRPDLIHLDGLGHALPRWASGLLARVPYLVGVPPLRHHTTTRRGRARPRLTSTDRRLVEGASALLLLDAADVWELQQLASHVPPIRVLPPAETDGPDRPTAPLIDLRDDGSLVGDWGFSVLIEPAGRAALIADVYRDLLGR